MYRNHTIAVAIDIPVEDVEKGSKMDANKAVLTAERVKDIFHDCLFRDEEVIDEYIPVDGLIQNVGFHPGRVEQHRQEIHDMLAELPDDFKISGGGGYSFLNVCMDRYGRQWTDSHVRQEQLIQLGIAIREAEFCLPKSLWWVFPGRVPYIKVRQ